MGFDFGNLLSQPFPGGAPMMGADGGMGVFPSLANIMQDPQAYQNLLTKLSMSGVAPPPLSGAGPTATMIPETPITPVQAGTPEMVPASATPAPNMAGLAPEQTPTGPTPLQKTVAGLVNPPQYPNTPAVAQPTPDLGKMLSGVAAMPRPQAPPRQPAPNPGTPHSYGGTTLARAPGYLPEGTPQTAQQSRMRSLGALLAGGR